MRPFKIQTDGKQGIITHWQKDAERNPPKDDKERIRIRIKDKDHQDKKDKDKKRQKIK
jgi:hypothetical protein